MALMSMVAVLSSDVHCHVHVCSWFEQDPEEYVTSVKTCLEEIARQCDSRQLKGIGITNQRETTVLWDRLTGKPFYPSIVWSDGRGIAAVVKRMIEATPSKSKDNLRVRNTSLSSASSLDTCSACKRVTVVVCSVCRLPAATYLVFESQM